MKNKTPGLYSLVVVMALLLIGSGFVLKDNQNQVTKTDETMCGGWDTFAEVICECDGNYDKSTCSGSTNCDGGTYYCGGACGACKCYQGEDREIPCTGTNEDGTTYDLLQYRTAD